MWTCMITDYTMMCVKYTLQQYTILYTQSTLTQY